MRFLASLATDLATGLGAVPVLEKGIGLANVKADWERAFAQSEALSIELGLSSISATGSVDSIRLYDPA